MDQNFPGGLSWFDCWAIAQESLEQSQQLHQNILDLGFGDVAALKNCWRHVQKILVAQGTVAIVWKSKATTIRTESWGA